MPLIPMEKLLNALPDRWRQNVVEYIRPYIEWRSRQLEIQGDGQSKIGANYPAVKSYLAASKNLLLLRDTDRAKTLMLKASESFEDHGNDLVKCAEEVPDDKGRAKVLVEASNVFWHAAVLTYKADDICYKPKQARLLRMSKAVIARIPYEHRSSGNEIEGRVNLYMTLWNIRSE